ncbi:MAG: RdgB/HAM1 family non-canonical purine NTP pyrophosphatase [Chitinophagaceae bacterium]|nr:RdgB/HAM1 family non-canonical purine NTP pyrophosphatase [Chitinophagaceae bacterium]
MDNNSLIFATNNQNKVNEIRAVLNNEFDILTLIEAGIDIDIPEPHNTLEANATEKSKTIYHLTKKNCFSEDTGLEVACLNGEPGVKSARYAGESRDFSSNIEKLLLNMQGCSNRNAQFRTVISLIINEKEYLFEGICKGQIALKESGSNGFGYDAVFVPNGSTSTFAEMTLTEKNIFSHRKKALEKLINFLTNKQNN